MNMNTKHLPFYIIGFGVLTSALIVGVALAQTPTGPDDANISYPVAELGNCKDKDACKKYCDDSAHLETCIAFAEKNNLMSKEEVSMAKKFLNAGAKGPGGCTGKDSCETYCNDINNINECVSFAEKSGMLPPAQLAEAKQVQSAIARGVKPPPCKNKRECDAYCDDPSNMKVCIAFGEAAGFLNGKELEDAKKMITAIDRGATPPPCRGREACDAYCSSPDNMEACMTFAQAAGFMSPQEAQDSQKMLAAVKKGVKPPACRGKEECDKYCSEDTHVDECINFSVAAGFMSAKDAEVAKKTGGKGPGGCKGKEECETFCNNQDNQQTCINFGRDNGLIPPEELQKMEEGQKQFQNSLQNMPAEVLTCLQGSVGSDTLDKFKSGQAMPSRDMGEKIGQCFSKMSGPPGQGTPGGPGAGGQMPPRGKQQGPQGNAPFKMEGTPGSFTGPGGCKTPEECKTLCESNPEACKNFQPPTTQPNMIPGSQERQSERQPNPQRQGESGNENFGKIMPFLEGKPIQDGLPFRATPPTGNMPPGSIPPQQGTQQMILPDAIQLLQGLQTGNIIPPTGVMPPSEAPQPATAPTQP